MQFIRIIGKLFVVSILLGSSVLVNRAFSKVDPPNYDFSLDKLDPFTPGKTYDSLVKLKGKGETIEDNGELKVYRFEVSHVRYKFPVFVQVKKEIITDFYARFPTYFLHDIFHQSLINRFGPQDKYHRQLNDAVYVWNNAKGNKIIYSGACTVTCFPNYVSFMKVEKKKGDTVSLLQKFSNQFLGTFPKK